MFRSQYLFKDGAVYSPWMERQADNIIFTVDLIDTSEGRIDVKLYHKNLEETGPGGAIGQTIQLSTAGRYSRGAIGLKELVRYKMTCVSIAATPQDYDHVLFRMLNPIWFDDVDAS